MMQYRIIVSVPHSYFCLVLISFEFNCSEQKHPLNMNLLLLQTPNSQLAGLSQKPLQQSEFILHLLNQSASHDDTEYISIMNTAARNNHFILSILDAPANNHKQIFTAFAIYSTRSNHILLPSNRSIFC